MAKLNKNMQKQVSDAETSGFEPLPDGAYHAKLRDVDTTREGPKGPYWSWEFEIVDEAYKGRRVWNNTSLSKEAAFKMRETFDAFGVSPDVDTDDLIGKLVKVVLTTRTIEKGARAGELANDVSRLKPADEDVLAEHDKRAKDQKEMADLF